ncbi:hypothetical protein BC831DRAFT_463942 [Entophlyctis helioformis]|nr:hypothetical protein BC831DRAFT_463942 [Entophlyctis helioformis]
MDVHSRECAATTERRPSLGRARTASSLARPARSCERCASGGPRPAAPSGCRAE